MSLDSLWLVGSTRSGKTTRLIEQFQSWAAALAHRVYRQPAPLFLVLAATGDNRLSLTEQISSATHGQYRFDSTTPLGFFQDEVTLFFPLLAQQLRLKTQFPLRLRPETEQDLATQLWRPELESGRLRQSGVRDYMLVRRTLDLLQLAAADGVPHEEIELVLKDGLQEGSPEVWSAMGAAIQRWRSWCLERGLLTYGLITELYWRYLLPHPVYQQQLKQRYRAVLADDVDEFPAVARSLLEVLLDQGIPGMFTYNPNGGIRLGLGADPEHLSGLAARCRVETLTPLLDRSLGAMWGEPIVNCLSQPMALPQLPDSIQAIQTLSRAELLREVTHLIAEAVQSGQIQPQEIAIITPGTDAITRYTLREILTRRGVAVQALNDQQPLISSPLVRALLTLLALVYPGLGRLLSQDAVAELLVVLSCPAVAEGGGLSSARIDPARAGLITDHCFVPDPDRPHLLPVSAFPRWDRLGYQATQAYETIVQWLGQQQDQQRQRLIPSPVALLDRAIQTFLHGGSHLPYDQLSVLRELMETAQHYWEVDQRLRQYNRLEPLSPVAVGRFIQLLRDGTITADPYPVRSVGKVNPAVTLATIYQYRIDRRCHRWQFWLDAGSPFWLSGGGGLFGAPLFLRARLTSTWTPEDALQADQQRLLRQVLDLLHRASDRVYLCHSDLATNGQDQAGSLITLVNAALPVTLASDVGFHDRLTASLE